MNEIVHQDQNYIWHPFTQHGIEKETIPIVNAKDSSLFTNDGKEIIDCISSWWTVTHGHNHPIINDAIKNQIDQMSHIMFAGFTHPPAVNLSQKLIEASTNNFDKVFFADNGSGAVEVALKMAYQYHHNNGDKNRTIFLAFDGGYHGDTFGAMATGQTTGFYEPYKPLLCDVKFIPFPEYYIDCEDIESKEENTINSLEKILEKNRNKISCMILEPLMQGASGMRFCRPEFVKKICTILRKEKILIIFDEVATGFGRTGSLFAYEQIDFIPDFICLSKGLTAGYMPMSVVMTHDKIYNGFLGSNYKNSFTHGHSFTANPLACAAAIASLEIFSNDNVMEKIKYINEIYNEYITRLKKIDKFENIRSLGSVLAWDLKTKDNEYKSGISEKYKDILLSKGLNIRPLGKTFYILPPYCTTKDQFKYIFDILFEIFKN